mgnify:CR=1 FL=1
MLLIASLGSWELPKGSKRSRGGERDDAFTTWAPIGCANTSENGVGVTNQFGFSFVNFLRHKQAAISSIHIAGLVRLIRHWVVVTLNERLVKRRSWNFLLS